MRTWIGIFALVALGLGEAPAWAQDKNTEVEALRRELENVRRQFDTPLAVVMTIAQQIGANILGVKTGLDGVLTGMSKVLPAGIRINRVYDLTVPKKYQLQVKRAVGTSAGPATASSNAVTFEITERE